MNKRYFVLLMVFLMTVLSGCTTSASQKNQGLTDHDKSVTTEQWAASDNTVHSVSWLPRSDVSVKSVPSDSEILVQHKLIDDVPVYEVFSKDAKLMPVMFFLHEHEGNKEQFLDEAGLYAQAGYFCVLFDLYGYGERARSEPVESIEAAVHATADIDLLLEYYRLSPYVEHTKFVLYGHSMGGSAVWHYCAFGGRKPQAIVVCSAAIDFTGIDDMGSVVNGKSQPPSWEVPVYQAYCQEHNPIEHYNSFINIPMLIYQGMKDHVVLPDLTRNFETIVSGVNPNATFIFDENGDHNATSLFLNRIIPFLRTFSR